MSECEECGTEYCQRLKTETICCLCFYGMWETENHCLECELRWDDLERSLEEEG